MRTSAASSDLSVVGEGKVEIVPDLATINVGFTVNKVAIEDAQKAVDTVNNELLKRMTILVLRIKMFKHPTIQSTQTMTTPMAPKLTAIMHQPT